MAFSQRLLFSIGRKTLCPLVQSRPGFPTSIRGRFLSINRPFSDFPSSFPPLSGSPLFSRPIGRSFSQSEGKKQKDNSDQQSFPFPPRRERSLSSFSAWKYLAGFVAGVALSDLYFNGDFTLLNQIKGIYRFIACGVVVSEPLLLLSCFESSSTRGEWKQI